MQMLTPQQIEQASSVLNQLSAAQRVWASGYLHGLASTNDFELESFSPSNAVIESVAPSQQTITVLYGSQTGNSQKIAEKLQMTLKALGYDVTLHNMLNYRNNQLKKETHLIAVISTHGNGEPPDEAIGFFKFINGPKAPKLDQLKFSVLALGDSSYDEFCQTGYELDARLLELGANRLHDVVACDVDFEEDATQWQEAVTTELGKALNHVGTIQFGDIAQSAANETAVYDAQNPFQADVLESLVLTDQGSDKQVVHLELSLEGSDLHYKPGDIVAIDTHNNAALVDSIVRELDLDRDGQVIIKGLSLSLADALLTRREISHVTRKQIQAYAEFTDNPELLAMANDKSQLQEEIKAADVLDVLQLWPTKITAQQLIDWLRPLAPRQYSIASSESASPEEVHVLVKQVEYEYRGRIHGGVCSTQLAQVEYGNQLGISIKPNKSFKLPESPDTKVIMIGAGTGVAPFRSFLFEREAQGVTGNSWLFFGEQYFQTNFLYQTEWQQFLKAGVLERMEVAFSRDQATKIYVQHRILENAEAIYEWLTLGAHLYVCGDMHHMAKDVHQALIEVVTQQSDRDEEAANQWLDQLILEQRYQRDIY